MPFKRRQIQGAIACGADLLRRETLRGKWGGPQHTETQCSGKKPTRDAKHERDGLGHDWCWWALSRGEQGIGIGGTPKLRLMNVVLVVAHEITTRVCRLCCWNAGSRYRMSLPKNLRTSCSCQPCALRTRTHRTGVTRPCRQNFLSQQTALFHPLTTTSYCRSALPPHYWSLHQQNSIGEPSCEFSPRALRS